MMMTPSDESTPARPDQPEEILRLLREQASLYARLDSLSKRQRSLVTGDDVGPLLTLLAARQKLSGQLTRVATLLAPARRDWSAYRARFSPTQRAEADHLVEESGDRLRRVIESDEQDARVLSGRREAVANALRSTHSTSRAISAYGARAPTAARLDCVDDGVR